LSFPFVVFEMNKRSLNKRTLSLFTSAFKERSNFLGFAPLIVSFALQFVATKK